VFRGKRNTVNKLPKKPEMKYITTNLYFEKLSSTYDPKINRETMFEKRCRASPCRNIDVTKRHSSKS